MIRAVGGLDPFSNLLSLPVDYHQSDEGNGLLQMFIGEASRAVVDRANQLIIRALIDTVQKGDIETFKSLLSKPFGIQIVNITEDN